MKDGEVSMAKTCCFTGHRTIPSDEYKKIHDCVMNLLDELYLQDYRYFGVGGALGFDTLAAECLLEYKKTHPLIRIIEVLPFHGYRSYWTEAQKEYAASIDQAMDKIVFCCETPSRSAFLVRDRHLVDCSSACISYCTRLSGGTAYTVKYALKHNLPVYNTSAFDVHVLLEQSNH